MKAVKARGRMALLLNEVILALRAHHSGPVHVSAHNVDPQDAAFFRAVAKVVEVWANQTRRR